MKQASLKYRTITIFINYDCSTFHNRYLKDIVNDQCKTNQKEISNLEAILVMYHHLKAVKH